MPHISSMMKLLMSSPVTNNPTACLIQEDRRLELPELTGLCISEGGFSSTTASASPSSYNVFFMASSLTALPSMRACHLVIKDTCSNFDIQRSTCINCDRSFWTSENIEFCDMDCESSFIQTSRWKKQPTARAKLASPGLRLLGRCFASTTGALENTTTTVDQQQQHIGKRACSETIQIVQH